MESSLLLPRFTPTLTRTPTRHSSPLFSPALPSSSLRLRAPPRHICLSASSPGGSNATDGGEGEGERGSIRNKEDLGALLGKVLDAYRNSNKDLRTFLQNLVDAGVVDESDVFGGAEDDDLLRALIDADLPGGDPDLGVLWKLPAVAAFSFVGVPTPLGYLGDAAGARVPDAARLLARVVPPGLPAGRGRVGERRGVGGVGPAAGARGGARFPRVGGGAVAGADLGGVPAVRRPPGRAVRRVLGELRSGGGGLVARVGGARQEHPRRRPPSRRWPWPEQQIGTSSSCGRNASV